MSLTHPKGLRRVEDNAPRADQTSGGRARPRSTRLRCFSGPVDGWFALDTRRSADEAPSLSVGTAVRRGGGEAVLRRPPGDRPRLAHPGVAAAVAAQGC